MEIDRNKIVAQDLIDYAKKERRDIKIVLPMLDIMLTNRSIKDFPDWDWRIANFIDDETFYIEVEKDYDVDFQPGERGPVAMGAATTPIGVKINDRSNLFELRQEVDNILNHTNEKISKYLSLKDKPKWRCKHCDRFLGKELSSFEEIQKLLINFDVGNYWKCRSCKMRNYFKFTNRGIVFMAEA